MSKDYIEIKEEIEKEKKENNFNLEKLENEKLDFSKKDSKSDSVDSKNGKWLVIGAIIIFLYLIYQPLMNLFVLYLQNNPTMYKYYLYIFSEINNNTLNGLLMVSILGSLFFLILPSEAIFIYYLSSTEYNPILIIFLTILGSIIGLSFNYFFGKLLGEKLLQVLFKKNFDKYKNMVNKWGGVFVFFGNIFPGPMEVLAVFFGGFKFKYSRFVLLSALGRLIKYLALFIAFVFFWDTIINYYDSFFSFL